MEGFLAEGKIKVVFYICELRHRELYSGEVGRLLFEVVELFDLGIRGSREVGEPACGLRSRLSSFNAFGSYSRRPQISQIQHGKSGTVIKTSPSQVK